MKPLTMLATPDGKWVFPNSAEFFAALGDSDPDYDAIAFAVKEGLAVTYVTEDTTRSKPEDLARLSKSAIDAGARRLCLCDTVGYATPDGASALVRWVRETVGPEIGLDWHGHNDRGLGVTNTIHALEYGADRAHGTILGVGERVGNAALDQVLFNL